MRSKLPTHAKRTTTVKDIGSEAGKHVGRGGGDFDGSEYGAMNIQIPGEERQISVCNWCWEV